MDADAQPATSARPHREGIVNLGRAGIVDRKRFHGGKRQIGRRDRRLVRRKAGAAREVFVNEAAVVILVGAAQRTCTMQQARRSHAGGGACGLERLVSDRLLVRLVEQLRYLCAQGFRHDKAREFFGMLRGQFGLALLALDRRQRSLERLLRRRLVSATTLLVEIHRGGMQARHQRRRLHRTRRPPEVFHSKLGEAKLVLGRHLPQEIKIDGFGLAFGFVQKTAQPGGIEAQQDCR